MNLAEYNMVKLVRTSRGSAHVTRNKILRPSSLKQSLFKPNSCDWFNIFILDKD